MRSDQIGCHRPSVPYYAFSFIHTSPPTSITPCIKVASVITFTSFSYKPYYGVLSLQPRLLFSPFSTPFLFGWFTNGSHIIESSLKHFSAQYTSTTLSRTLGGFICTFSLPISLSITQRTSKFRNQFTIGTKYFDNERPILVLSLLRFSEMTSELITFNHLIYHSSSTALGTKTDY